ncbi:MAG: ubiquinol-cytochrome c reductase iron-sulfur subunit [Gemmatimonadales bacterium]
MQPDHQQASPPCALCGIFGAAPSRRDFLREAASLVACAAALGVAPGNSLQFSVSLTTALRLVGGEAVYPIPQQDGATIDRDREVILVRYQNRVYAFGLSCPHQRTALRWQDEERRFQCPKHKSTFQMDGTFLSGRATRSMDRRGIRREGDTVVVDLSTLFQEDKDPERWGQAVVQV